MHLLPMGCCVGCDSATGDDALDGLAKTWHTQNNNYQSAAIVTCETRRCAHRQHTAQDYHAAAHNHGDHNRGFVPQRDQRLQHGNKRGGRKKTEGTGAMFVLY